MAAMHENFPPVYYNTSPNIGNAWHVTRYEDAYFVLRHPEIFSSHGSVGFPRDPRDWFYFIPLEIDPPDHRKYRNIVDPLFSPKAIAKLENYRSEEHTSELQSLMRISYAVFCLKKK